MGKPATEQNFVPADLPLFGILFAPLVVEARERLRQYVGAKHCGLLTAEAHAGWENFLISRLYAAGSQAVEWQLQIFRAVRAAFPKEQGQTQQEDSLEREFLGTSSGERLGKVFGEFPRLAEICEVLIKNWVSTVSEFLVRLDADSADLPDHFGGGSFALPVNSLQAGLSDPHHGGRCVVRIGFASAASLIYKPRSLAPEAHFSCLLDYLNTRAILHPLRSASCWDCGDYGWMEDIALEACNAFADVEAFYWRAGVLLGTVYLSRGVDMHQENLIAAAGSPVLIDLETLWHPQNSTGTEHDARSDSVLRTGFLPVDDQATGHVYKSSALCRRGRCENIPLAHENNPNFEAKKTPEHCRHLPVFKGKPYPASDFIAEIQEGFRWVGEQLLGSDAGWIQFDRWLHVLVGCRRRLILRSSSRYQNIFKQLTSPHYLRQTVIPNDCLPPSAQAADPPLTGAEIQAIRQMDIPHLPQINLACPDESMWRAKQRARFFSQVLHVTDALAATAD